MKVVIVGGVAGGATAAARIRRLDEHAEIIIFERSGFISYANCGLPYYIGGVIEDENELTLQTPQSFWDRFRIDVRVRHEVISLHPKTKAVRVKNLVSGEVFEERYDKLVLAPGAQPTRPNLPGIDSERVFSLRTVEDTLRIHRFVQEKQPKSAVLVGGGYIGVEMAENLRERGLDVSIVQRPLQLMNTLDYDMAMLVHAELRKHGVVLSLGSNVIGFRDDGDSITTLLAGTGTKGSDGNGSSAGGTDGDNGTDGSSGGNPGIKADMVLLAIGVTPESSLAKDAGLELGAKGSIVVNERMETSVPDIYAVGDAVQVRHFITGENALISLAGPANKQARIAADNICGGDSRYQGSLGSSVIKVFDLTVAGMGLTEKAAAAAGFDYDSVVLSPGSHASYYPGAKTMTLKVVFERGSLRLLGAQVIGSEGVDKRLDVLATALQGGIRADKLKDLDLAYAPPYSSAKDPVNMVGFIIENLASGKVRQYRWNDIERLPRDGSVTLLDTRIEGEYACGHLDGFINLPVDDLRVRLGEIDRSKPVYVLCQSGLRSYVACRILAQEGFECFNLSGGYRFYEAVTSGKKMGENAFPCGMERG